MSTIENENAVPQGSDGEQQRSPRHKMKVVIGLVTVLAAVVVGLGIAFFSGVLVPPGAAAQYDGHSYIMEDEVTDYVSTYKTSMQLADADDATWATFLSNNNLTPERLRYSTIFQLVCNALVEKEANERGIAVSDEEIDSSLESLKAMTAFGDDDIWNQAMESRGQTMEGLRETYRLSLLRQKVLTAAVEIPEASDEQIISYLQSTVPVLNSTRVKHTYCFKVDGLDENGSLEKISAVQNYRKEIVEAGVDKDTFVRHVQMFSNNDELVEKGGANGWNIDTSSYSERYIEAIENTDKGEVSQVFNDGDGYAFIWVDEVYRFPVDSEKIKEIDLSKMPDSLYSYLSDTTGYQLWKSESESWLQSQAHDSNIQYYPIPADVFYNVDMSLAAASEQSDGEDDVANQDGTEPGESG